LALAILLAVEQFLLVNLAHGATAETLGPLPEQKADLSKGCCDHLRADDIWLISTRHLDCPCFDKESSDVDLEVKQYIGEELVESSLHEFLGTADPTQPTLFYVHGNRVECDDVLDRGLQAYHGLLDCSCSGPVRFVIWSWPSGQMRGPLKDIRIKAARTNGEAHYLAWLLGQMDPATPTGIVGYSYGARVATGALHVLGGGELAGCTLPSMFQRSGAAINVVLMAAAVHNYWLQPEACHERALPQIDRLLIQYNTCDPVLKRYKFVEKRSKPQALGYTGMHIEEGVETWIDQRDVCCLIGKTHAEEDYFSSAEITDEARETLSIP
jgi:hypothetical protein